MLFSSYSLPAIFPSKKDFFQNVTTSAVIIFFADKPFIDIHYIVVYRGFLVVYYVTRGWREPEGDTVHTSVPANVGTRDPKRETGADLFIPGSAA